MLRTLLLPALTVAGLLLSAAPAHAAPAEPAAVQAAAALPTVDMAAVVTASQVEGYRGNQLGLRDDASTKRVQRALTARGFPVPATGRYGRGTTAAYIKFQRSMGYRSIDANGIPGPASLAALGRGRYTVTNVVQVGSRKDKHGTKRVNTRTRRMLIAADAQVPGAFRVSQGSYCKIEKIRCAAASAGSHDGGGAIDLSVSGLSSTRRWQTVKALRSVGFAAWLRTSSQCGGCWPDHIHAIAIADTDLWQSDGKYGNRDQVADYYVGRNGLSGHALDNTPLRYRVPFTTWERYLRATR